MDKDIIRNPVEKCKYLLKLYNIFQRIVTNIGFAFWKWLHLRHCLFTVECQTEKGLLSKMSDIV